MSTDDPNLSKVYAAKNAYASREAYDEWASSYDAFNLSKGYRIPEIACAMIARHIGVDADPILEAGCGTGVFGQSLTDLGYQHLIGVDLSPQMLRQAKQRFVYQRLYEHDLGQSLPEQDDSFSAVLCFGSLGPGHAPASCLDEFVRVTRAGGHIVFNTRAETYPKQDLRHKVDSLSEAGLWTAVDQSSAFRTFHLTEPELTSQVFVFKVC